MKIAIPKLSLVVLIGPSGSGKSTFARKHFLPTEVLSSDACRGMVSDDENDQTVTTDAFEVLHFVAGKRLALGRLTVVDATNVQLEARKPLVQLARQHHCLPVAIVLNLPEKVCHERNRSRDERAFGPHVVRQQVSQLRRSLRGLGREGFRHVFILHSPEDVEAATIERVPLWNDKRDEHGPFDIFGDVHGCCDELEVLLQQLGYRATNLGGDTAGWSNQTYIHAEGRKVVFVGDLVDRGPRILDTVRLVRNMVRTGSALCVPGNHDMKLLRKLRGKDVQITHGLANSLAEIDALPADVREPFCKDLAEFLDGLVSHYVLDDGKLVVAHAGMKAEMQGRGSGKVRDFALYGETTGETDEFGLPVRFNWAADYRGQAMVVYGHTPVPEPDWLNRTVNIDTGCVFGGKLTALRYPEKEFVSVPAARTYCEPARPFLPEEQQAPKLSAQQAHDDLLDAEDVLGKRIVTTRLRGTVTIREAHATAALEVMSRFAANPKWLIYLPPTMSPCETTGEPGLLEHPAEAFAYYRSQGAPQAICEEKHMGSRAVVVVCRDEQTARERFGVTEGEIGIVYTRTGRRFFNDPTLETQFLDRVREALTAADVWTNLATTWVCLDCELMPWSAKAQELLKTQYAAVGAAGTAALPKAVAALAQAAERLNGDERGKAEAVLAECRSRTEHVGQFVAAYRQYCWPVASLTDLKLAPFHLLASDGRVHTDKNHVWHMDTLAAICRADPELLLATPYTLVDVTDPASQGLGPAAVAGDVIMRRADILAVADLPLAVDLDHRRHGRPIGRQPEGLSHVRGISPILLETATVGCLALPPTIREPGRLVALCRFGSAIRRPIFHDGCRPDRSRELDRSGHGGWRMFVLAAEPRADTVLQESCRDDGTSACGIGAYVFESVNQSRDDRVVALMDTDLLNSKFARIGARLKVADRPTRRNRHAGVVSLDVQADCKGEFFEIARRPGAEADVAVLDVQPAERHLLLLVREGKDKSKFLCGHDERHWFVAGIPESAPVGTVRQAKEALKPAEVRLAQALKGLRSEARARRKNAAYVRQGEWFFIPAGDLAVDEKLVLRIEPLVRGNGGKPHWAEFCYRTGGEQVYVCGRYPNGVTGAEYQRLLAGNPKAKGWGWRAMRRNAGVYVRGRIRHPDHATITLHGWGSPF